jgi:hypothetical protein
VWRILFISENYLSRHIVFCFRRLYVRLSGRMKLVRLSHVKVLAGFQTNFTGSISTNPYCAYRRHVSLHLTTWPELELEQSCQLSKVNMLTGFHWNFTGVVSSYLSDSPARSALLHIMDARAKKLKCLVSISQLKFLTGFQWNFTGVISTIYSCVYHRQASVCRTKWPPEQKEKYLVRLAQVKLLTGFRPNFTGIISTIPSCSRHILWQNPFMFKSATSPMPLACIGKVGYFSKNDIFSCVPAMSINSLNIYIF